MLDFVINSLETGGWFLLPIFIASVIGWVLVLNACMRMWGLSLPNRWLNRLYNNPAQVDSWVQKEGRRYQRTVAGEALLRLAALPAGTDQEFMENTLDEVMRYKQPLLDKDLGLISVITSMAPLLGLLGTVGGMIGTFRVIGAFGTSNPALMADSIAEALITTQDGLLVAFPLMVMHLILYNKSAKTEQRAQDTAFRYIRYRQESVAVEAAHDAKSQ